MGRLRIIAGRLKGRRIDVPDARHLRPTAERVREALFNILGPAIAGSRVLDAYCGTGALGLEAISRGAQQVVFIDDDPAAARALESVLERLVPGEGFRVLCGGVTTLMTRAGLAFDVILADPPYAGDEARAFLPLASSCLSARGQIVLEREARDPPVESTGLELFRGERYGRTRLDFYRRARVTGLDPAPPEG